VHRSSPDGAAPVRRAEAVRRRARTHGVPAGLHSELPRRTRSRVSAYAEFAAQPGAEHDDDAPRRRVHADVTTPRAGRKPTAGFPEGFGMIPRLRPSLARCSPRSREGWRPRADTVV
jgi:hypothetical protein